MAKLHDAHYDVNGNLICRIVEFRNQEKLIDVKIKIYFDEGFAAVIKINKSKYTHKSLFRKINKCMFNIDIKYK